MTEGEPRCRHYHVLSDQELAREATAKARSAKARQFVSRPIRHPNFKNVSALQAAELLRSAAMQCLPFHWVLLYVAAQVRKRKQFSPAFAGTCIIMGSWGHMPGRSSHTMGSSGSTALLAECKQY